MKKYILLGILILVVFSNLLSQQTMWYEVRNDDPTPNIELKVVNYPPINYPNYVIYELHDTMKFVVYSDTIDFTNINTLLLSGSASQYVRGDGSIQSFPVEVDGSVTNEIEIPAQTGNAGKFLTTNGVVVSWQSQKRQETYSGVTDSIGNYTVNFGSAYLASPNIQFCIANQSGTNQFVRCTSISTTGFTINAYSFNDILGAMQITTSNLVGVNIDVLITEK